MNEYSLWADLLNKFHTSPEWIQVLWLFAVPLLLFGLSWCVKEVLVAFAPRQREDAKGELVYSIYRNSDDELLVYRHTESLFWQEERKKEKPSSPESHQRFQGDP